VEKHAECLPALKVLDISNCLNISSKGMEALGRHCKLLVQLKRNIPPPDLPQGFNAAATNVVAEEEALAVANTMPMLETARACLQPVQRRWASPLPPPPRARRHGRRRAGSGLVVSAASAATREADEHAARDLGQRDVDSGGDGGHDGEARKPVRSGSSGGDGVTVDAFVRSLQPGKDLEDGARSCAGSRESESGSKESVEPGGCNSVRNQKKTPLSPPSM
jgi:hypothetical protein